MPVPTPAHRGPKFLARLQDFRRKPGAPDGTLSFTVEWLRATGAAGGGKLVLDSPLAKGDGLSDWLREAVADSLAALFPAENVRERDVQLIGA